MRVISLILTISMLVACQVELKKKEKNERQAGQADVVACSPDGVNRQGGSTGQNQQNYGLMNGQIDNGHPSVVLLLKEKRIGNAVELTICTGTFVSDNTLFTAGHCIDRSANGGVIMIKQQQLDLESISQPGALEKLRSQGIRPISAFSQGFTEENLIGPNGEAINVDKTHLDFAVLVFNDNVAPGVTPLLDRPTKAGDPGVLVGYGYTSREASDDSMAQKRFGNTVLSNIQQERGLLTLYEGPTGNQQSSSVYALSAHGDSGGPLLVQGAIAGISSSGGKNPVHGNVSLYVDLNSVDSQTLIREIKKSGGRVTLNGERPPAQFENDQVQDNTGC